MYYVALNGHGVRLKSRRSLTDEPLLDRKRALRKLVRNRRGGRIRYTDYVLRDGKGLFEKLESVGGGDGGKAR